MTDPTSFSQLAKYKERVRAEAIRVAAEQRWCDDGLNTTLRNLDLAPKQRFTVKVRVKSEQVVKLRVDEAESLEQAIDMLRSDPERTSKSLQRRTGMAATDFEVVEPPAQPDADSGVPTPGQPAPEEGEWYAKSAASGGPNQCRVTSDYFDGVYCTRSVEHPADWHVAAGKNAGVLATWPAQEGDVRSDAGRFAGVSMDLAEDDDDDDDEVGDED